MPESSDVPATTNPNAVMNTVIHHAVTRDLERLRAVLVEPMSRRRRDTISSHMQDVVRILHHHHEGEDEGVWPAVLAKRPDLADLLEQMEQEHQALSEAADALDHQAELFRTDGSRAANDALREAAERLLEVTVPHLEHEENQAMPLVVESLTDEDWRVIGKEHFGPPPDFPPRKQLWTVLWLYDDLDPERSKVVSAELPRPVRYAANLLVAKQYERETTLAWGSLAATKA